MNNENIIKELLSRGVVEVIDQNNLESRLKKGETLRIKFGIDPTSPDIHIGRAATLLKLRDFQQLGHKIIFIIGDFTAVIGDTSDKESERPMLSKEEVKKNMESYLEQASKVIDIDNTEIVYNSEWLEELNYHEIGDQADVFSVADFIARKNIKDRLSAGKRVSLREVLYPLMQGYDSVAVKADVEIGGTDQRFNLLAGRTLQEKYGQKPQDIITMNLIKGTDGRKMSSSWGNTINLNDDPKQMYGKIMSMPDDIIVEYFIHLTRVPMKEINEIDKKIKSELMNPRDAKMRLADEITQLFWEEEGVKQGKEHFVNTFQKKEVPEDIKEVKVSSEKLLDILVECGLVSSSSEGRRLIEQKGIKIDGVTADNESQRIESGSLIQKGKREFRKVV